MSTVLLLIGLLVPGLGLTAAIVSGKCMGDAQGHLLPVNGPASCLVLPGPVNTDVEFVSSP